MLFKRSASKIYVSIGLLTIILGIVIYHHVNSTLRYQVPQNLVTYKFSIEPNESVNSIISRMAEKGYIINKNTLVLYLKLHSNLVTNIQAGEYRIGVGTTPIELLKSFQNGTNETTLTFIEGWRREQYAHYLVQKMSPEFATEFLMATNDLEGYLFPDTYFVDENTTVEGLIEKFRENYNTKTQDLSFDNLPAGISQNDAIILASLVEREASDYTDKSIIAGILIKRLVNGLNGWALDIDASVQYALASNAAVATGINAAITDDDFNWWPKVLTEDDLNVESSFNTRKYAGLPPAPICNPGLDSIRAITDPIASEYWYYFVDTSGVTHFSQTLDEHNYQISVFGVSE